MPFILPFPDIGPEIFSIQIGNFTLAPRWYALAYIVGLVVAWRWVVALVKRPELWPDGKAPIAPKQVEDLLTWVILGVILGGRLGFVLFYQPGFYFANPLEIIKIWEGGMSFHGGFLGVIVAGVLFARKHGLPVASLGDSFALTAPVGLFLVRLTNFINGELWGKPTTVPWAFVFPGERAQYCPEGWVGPCGRHPSQLYEAALEGLVLGLLLAWLAYRRGWLKVPGRLTAMFLIGYGLARSFVELFREADAQFISPDNPMGYVIRFGSSIDSWGLSMGQVLSLPMVLVGLALLWWANHASRSPRTA